MTVLDIPYMDICDYTSCIVHDLRQYTFHLLAYNYYIIEITIFYHNLNIFYNKHYKIELNLFLKKKLTCVSYFAWCIDFVLKINNYINYSDVYIWQDSY